MLQTKNIFAVNLFFKRKGAPLRAINLYFVLIILYNILTMYNILFMQVMPCSPQICTCLWCGFVSVLVLYSYITLEIQSVAYLASAESTIYLLASCYCVRLPERNFHPFCRHISSGVKFVFLFRQPAGISQFYVTIFL